MPARPPSVIVVPLLTVTLAALAAAASVHALAAALLPVKPMDVERPQLRAPEPAAALAPGELARVTGVSSRPRRPRLPPGPSRVDARLLGTLVSTDGGFSLATVEDRQARRARTLMVGDVWMQVEVIGIDRARVLLRRGGELEYLEMGGAAPAAASGPIVVESSVPSSLPSLQLDSPGRWSVRRSDVEQALGDLGSLSRDARLLPVFGPGAGGFRFTHVRPGSVYTRLGLQSGDVIRRVNGYALDDPGKLLEVYQRLRDAPLIELEVERAGQTTRHAYRIRE